MSAEDWKSRLGVVFSTNPDFSYDSSEENELETLANSSQRLFVSIDRRNRGGKQVTLVKGFVGKEEDLISLSKTLKNKLGVGGAAKDGEIMVQGDFREKMILILTSLGYGAKRAN